MCDYLQRRQSRYYFRRRIPCDLVPVLGRQVYQKALGTADPALARVLCRELAVETDRQWESLRRQRSAASGRVVGAKSASATYNASATYIDEPRLSQPTAPLERPLEARRRAASSLSEVVGRWASERKPSARTEGRTRAIVTEFERHVGQPTFPRFQ